MKNLLWCFCISSMASVTALPQTHGCHVYVLDVARGKEAMEKLLDEGKTPANVKAVQKAQTLFPEFEPDYSEERLTTKTYPFPRSKWIITASVMSTDESMASAAGRDSLLLGIVVAPTAQPNALNAENNAVSEITFNDETDTVRVKKYLKMGSILYLAGLECRVKERKPKTDK